jgi:hypothetical protein
MAQYTSIYLLLQLGGTAEPTKEDVSKVLEGAGVEVRYLALLVCDCAPFHIIHQHLSCRSPNS